MQVKITFMSGYELFLSCSEEDRVYDVKQRVYEQKIYEDNDNVDSFNDLLYVCRQELFYENEPLQNSTPLSSFNYVDTLCFDILIKQHPYENDYKYKLNLKEIPKKNIIIKGDEYHIFFSIINMNPERFRVYFHCIIYNKNTNEIRCKTNMGLHLGGVYERLKYKNGVHTFDNYEVEFYFTMSSREDVVCMIPKYYYVQNIYFQDYFKTKQKKHERTILCQNMIYYFNMKDYTWESQELFLNKKVYFVTNTSETIYAFCEENENVYKLIPFTNEWVELPNTNIPIPLNYLDCVWRFVDNKFYIKNQSRCQQIIFDTVSNTFFSK